jgi:CRISPR-associated protein Csd1
MILTELCRYANETLQGEAGTPEEYLLIPVRWSIQLDEEGELIQVSSLGGDQKTKKGIQRAMPYVQVTSGIEPSLMVGNGEYVLGIGRDPDKQDPKVLQRHNAFKGLLQKCVAEVPEESSLQAVAAFLDRWNPETDFLTLFDDEEKRKVFTAGDTITFQVDTGNDDMYPTDLPAVQRFWASHIQQKKGGDFGQCLVTGQDNLLLAETMPIKIRGIPDGHTSGTALVSANSPPFESYGRSRSLSSPISRQAGESFAKAINHLLNAQSTEPNRLRIGSVAYMFWTRDPQDFEAVESELQHLKPSIAKELYRSPYTARPQADDNVPDGQLYALALSASVSRAVIRDWLEVPIKEAKANLNRWFAGQKMVLPMGKFPKRPLSATSLAKSLFMGGYADVEEMEKDDELDDEIDQAEKLPEKRDLTSSQKVVAGVATELVRSALSGRPLAIDLLMRAVQRNRIERSVTYPRAALIKLVLTYSQERSMSMDDMESMNSENHDPAYLCGRLLSVLEVIQSKAVKSVNATLVDRYYGGASSTPDRIFPSLLKMATSAHLPKLRKDPKTKDASVGLQKSLESILYPHLTEFPKTLDLQKQGLFALGYYHQCAQNRANAAAAKAAKMKKQDSTEN